MSPHVHFFCIQIIDDHRVIIMIIYHSYVHCYLFLGTFCPILNSLSFFSRALRYYSLDASRPNVHKLSPSKTKLCEQIVQTHLVPIILVLDNNKVLHHIVVVVSHFQPHLAYPFIVSVDNHFPASSVPSIKPCRPFTKIHPKRYGETVFWLVHSHILRCLYYYV